MTVTASIKENTGFGGVIWGWHSQKHIPEDQHLVPTPHHALKPTEILVSSQFCWGGFRQIPSYSKLGLLSEIQSALGKGWTPSPRGSLVGIAHSSLWGNCVPSKVQAPHTMQQHLGYTQAAGVRYYSIGAEQPKYLANRLPSIKCRNSKLGWLQQQKCQKGMRYSYSEQVSAQQAENKVRTAPAPPSQEILYTTCSVLTFSVSISSCINTHTEYVTQQLNKLNQAL